MSINQNCVSVSSYIAEELHRLGVSHVFGYQGANITYMIDAISTHSSLKYVQTSHEQGASFAANGYAQASGILGAAVTSGGPGALNLVTGIANAYCDSIPTIFICGDLSRRYKKTKLPLRQDGFQSADIVSVVEPITKYCVQVDSPENVRYCFERAIFEATSGRQGPALISIPHWIQRSEIDPISQKGYVAEELEIVSEIEANFDAVINILAQSNRPLVLVGGGCSRPETHSLLSNFLTQHSLPSVVSLCGLGAISHDHSSYVGFVGDYGHRHANLALAAADCLLVLGSRMDERQVGFLKDSLKDKTIIHIDIDPSELHCPSDNYFPILTNVNDFIKNIAPIAPDRLSWPKWNNYILELKKKYPPHIFSSDLSPSLFLSGLFGLLGENAQVYVDVGLHQMCTAQSSVLTHGKKLFFSGGLGSMGYALPASIGGYLARPKQQTICIAGDGGLMMSLPELQTIIRDQFDIKIIVMNNYCLGMVRNHQATALGGRTVGAVEGYLAGDFKKMAYAFDLNFFQIGSCKEFEKLDQILDTKGPTLIEVVFPSDMMPFPASVDYPLYDEYI